MEQEGPAIFPPQDVGTASPPGYTREKFQLTGLPFL